MGPTADDVMDEVARDVQKIVKKSKNPRKARQIVRDLMNETYDKARQQKGPAAKPKDIMDDMFEELRRKIQRAQGARKMDREVIATLLRRGRRDLVQAYVESVRIDAALADKLDGIKVLYRAPDTMALYGIPYRMRRGQQPRDLSQRYRSDWLWLGSPGWWGSMSREDQAAVERWLQRHKNDVPERPHEWSEV